ncbi:MAG: emopamil-binding family protein [Myxococcales bacterium]|nr:emopamil-binding family protein [Myxococcales bacterium]
MMTALPNLPLRQRRVDLFLAVVFVVFAISTAISDTIPTFGIELTPDSPNPVVRMNYAYAMGTDPLFMHPPVWMRMVTGLSLFVYAPFYLVLAWCLVKGKNAIQLPAVMFASVICTVTGVIVFGVEFFGEPEFRTPNPVKYLALNLPYVVMPLVLLVRMRKPMPFTRTF